MRMGSPVDVVDDFVSREECALLLAGSERCRWHDSLSALADGRSMAVAGGGRRSRSLWGSDLDGDAARILQAIEERLTETYDVGAGYLEAWQMSRYRRGDRFGDHLDCGAFADHPSGERVRTFLIVLEAPRKGGATHFRALRITVRPVPGRLISWRNLLPSGKCNHAMIHAGRPVWQGRKTILTTWTHERAFA